MDFLKLVKERYSVRKFKNQSISDDDIQKIIEAANVAPTAHNLQPQEIIVVNSKKGLETFRKCTECHYDAPLAFIISYNKEKCWVRSYDGKNSGEVDASIITTHMMLEASALGIGSTWIMFFIPEAVKVEFDLPDNIEPVALLVMGYEDGHNPSERHFKRRNPNEYITYR